MSIRAWRPWVMLARAQRPSWLDVGGRWPPTLWVLTVLPLTVGLQVLFAYHATSVGLGVLIEVLIVSLVMARSCAIRWYDVVSLTATLCLAEFVFFVGPARWIWQYDGFSNLSIVRLVGRPAVIATSCGQVVLALLLLAGLDPQVRRNIRGFISPVGRGFALRAVGATVLLACALWTGLKAFNGGTIVQVKVVLASVVMVPKQRPPGR